MYRYIYIYIYICICVCLRGIVEVPDIVDVLRISAQNIGNSPGLYTLGLCVYKRGVLSGLRQINDTYPAQSVQVAPAFRPNVDKWKEYLLWSLKVRQNGPT